LIDLNLRPSRDTLRKFGFVALVAFGLLGGLVVWKRSLVGIQLGEAAPVVAYVLWGVGILSALLSLAAPGLNRFLYVGLTLLTFPIGFVFSHVLLAVVFYLVFTPVGLVMRLLGRDPLQRRFDREAGTYWVDHVEPRSVEEYFRQY
jgi:saxitoxin biosynthesis operon SxtJ-like protein